METADEDRKHDGYFKEGIKFQKMLSKFSQWSMIRAELKVT